MLRRPVRLLCTVAPLAPLALAVLGPASAQEPLPRPLGHPVAVDLILEKPHQMSRESGPPGTQVILKIEQLPAVTPLWLGIGAPRLGFEALTLVLTSPTGELRQEVAVPSWAGRDRSARFIVFDAYFRPIMMTEPFHVTARDGSVLRQGRTGLRIESCASLVDEDGVAYALDGQYASLGENQEVIMEGVIRAPAGCGGLTRLDVTRVYPLRSAR